MTMEAVPPPGGTVAAPVHSNQSRRGALRRLLAGDRQALVGTVVLALFVAVAVAAPVLSPYSPTAKVGDVYGRPSPAHWLGLDDGGIDMLTLLIWGARVSLLVGFAASLMAMLIGGTVG
ncbi:MAG: ABC transporter permease, partial [Acidimicrobiia bacterium]